MMASYHQRLVRDWCQDTDDGLSNGVSRKPQAAQMAVGKIGKPQPNGKERLGSGNRVLQSGKCDIAKTIY
jgi:hypothetical protein